MYSVLEVTPRRTTCQSPERIPRSPVEPQNDLANEVLSGRNDRMQHTLLRCFDASAIKVIEMVGVGKGAVVVKAKLSKHGLVAVKCIPTTQQVLEDRVGIRGDDFSLSLPSEILIHSLLRHERIPQFIGICLDRTEVLLIQQLVATSALSEKPADLWSLMYQSKEELTLLDIIRFGIDIASALDYIHEEQCICHCDITPKNILINQENNAFLADFGCARHIPNVSGSCAASKLKGCTNYLAPEVIGTGSFSAKSDIYSFGTVLLEMLVGEMPWQGVSDCEIEYQMQVKKINAFQHLGKDILERSFAARPCDCKGRESIFGLVGQLLAFEARNRPSAKAIKTLLCTIEGQLSKPI